LQNCQRATGTFHWGEKRLVVLKLAKPRHQPQ
jgi:hypothetical protein